jgi:hypothetical protein
MSVVGFSVVGMTMVADPPAGTGVVPVLAGVSEALDHLADPTGWRLQDGDLERAVDDAYGLVTRAHAVALRLLAEVDARGLPTAAGASSTQAWLVARRRLRPGEAKRDVTLARLVRAAATATTDLAAAATTVAAADPADPAVGDAADDGVSVEGAAVAAGLDAGG